MVRSRQARQPASVCLLAQMEAHWHCCSICCRPRRRAAFVNEARAGRRWTGVTAVIELTKIVFN